MRPIITDMRSRGTPASQKPTRREWTLLLAAAPLTAQVPSPATPAPVPSAGSNLPKALDEVRKVSERLSHLEVPMNVEPAFSFQA